MPDIDQMIRCLRANPWDDRYEPTTGDIADTLDRLREVNEAALSWLERWAMHVGNCSGGATCTCGLVAIRHELQISLQTS